MKKTKITLLVLIMALFTGLSAQAKFGFGPKIGMNFAKIHQSGFKSDDRCGFTGGITAEYISPLNIGADISLMYSHMKTDVEGYNVSGNFLEIPLHLKYKLGMLGFSSIVAPYIYTGPSVAFKMGGFNLGDYKTKSTEWGYDLGIGVELIKKLQIGAGYTWGLNNIAKKYYDGEIVNDIKVKNNYWTVTAAWMF